MNIIIKTIDYVDVKNANIKIDELFSLKYHAIIIKNVFDKEEIESIAFDISNLNKKWITNTPVGLTIPGVYNEGNDYTQMEKYFKSCEEYYNNFTNNFKVDFRERIYKIFKDLYSTSNIEIPKSIKSYKFASESFRIIFPYNGSIQTHCENYLYQLFNNIKNIINPQVSIYNSLSYFSLINKPTSGGELEIFHLTWNESKDKLDKIIVKNNFGKTELKDEYLIPKTIVELDEGDLIIFTAGQFWHRINPIQGIKNRVTLGGFIGEKIETKTLYYWT